MSIRGASRGSLPTISNHQLSYSQRYEHMTKLANYSELNEIQIWKEYQKLRACLKELNEQVLHHMEKKAYGSIGKSDKAQSKDQEGTLIVLEDQKRANQTRMNTYNNELARHQERIKLLSSKPNMLDELHSQSHQLQLRIKQIRKENKDLHRNAELQGRDLINNNSMLDKLVIEEQKLTRVFKQHKKHEQTLKIVMEKIDKFRERVVDLQKAIDMRVEQFSRTQNYIAEEIHFQRYQELKKQREAIGKYEPIYKRNYLMKLKELETIVNSLGKHDKIIQETEVNIINVRNQIDTISGLIGTQRKRFQSTQFKKKPERKQSVEHSAVEPSSPEAIKQVLPNDKNQVSS